MPIENQLSKLFRNSSPLITSSILDDINVEKMEELKKQGLDIAELRIDLFKKQSCGDILKEVQKLKNIPKIATIRSELEGGKWSKDDEENRLRLYKKIIPEVDAVDIELISSKIIDKVIFNAKQYNTFVIISHHNFIETPEYQVLQNVIVEADRKGADIVKIATHVNTNKDLEILKKLLLENKKPLIVIGMGEKGVVTRTSFHKYGSLLTFCSTGTKTAPGQISLEEMTKKLTKNNK